MSATVPYSQAKTNQSHEVYGWKLTVEGVEYPVGTDFSISSVRGSVQSAVVLKNDGTPLFDRPVYTETPFAQVVIWGKGADGKFYFGMVEQERPHADMPGAENYGVNGHKPVRFLHVVMGFNEKSATGKFETPEETAKREAHEESGTSKSAVLNVETHPFGHNPSPSFTSTWGNVISMEIDLKKVGKPITDENESINGVYFIEAHRLLEMIAGGQSNTGAYTGVSTSLSALMIHFARHPEQFPR
jgi:hypothetical protein